MFTALENTERLLNGINVAARHPKSVSDLIDFLEAETYGGEISCMNRTSREIMENFIAVLLSADTAVTIYNNFDKKPAGQQLDFDTDAIMKTLADSAAQLEEVEKILKGMKE